MATPGALFAAPGRLLGRPGWSWVALGCSWAGPSGPRPAQGRPQAGAGVAALARAPGDRTPFLRRNLATGQVAAASVDPKRPFVSMWNRVARSLLFSCPLLSRHLLSSLLLSPLVPSLFVWSCPALSRQLLSSLLLSPVLPSPLVCSSPVPACPVTSCRLSSCLASSCLLVLHRLS